MPEPDPVRAVGTTGEAVRTESGIAAADPSHRAGHDVDSVDQVGSVVLLGLAVAGAAVALALVRLVIG